MANPSSINNNIKANDFIEVGLIVSGGGSELITNVTSALDATTGKTKYTVTTTNRTLVMFEHQYQMSGTYANNQAPGVTGVSYWVVGQLE